MYERDNLRGFCFKINDLRIELILTFSIQKFIFLQVHDDCLLVIYSDQIIFSEVSNKKRLKSV
jgi:hypothetical protein